jgi:hypothetical protein
MTKPLMLIGPAAPTKQQMLDQTVEGLDRILPKMNSKWGRQQLRQALRDAVRGGTLSRLQVINAAEAGFAEADLALREEFVEIRERGEQVPLSLGGYMQRAVLRAPGGRGRGNELLEDFARNMAVCILVIFVRVSWKQTRGRAFDIVSEALGKRRITLSARRVENIFNGLKHVAKLLAGQIPA